ncbi:unnamed protein product [Polarella glacialis]|uniref:Uncharacterized protein n=1 Tax=Polarella glacialis TaxID=89957 RepID=A0A813GK85_POLGL|nr:unnamed protein product [Polarella glacialis]
MFPGWYRKRLTFLSWVGKELKLSPVWVAYVLPFLSVENWACTTVAVARFPTPSADLRSQTWYHSKTHNKWLQCAVTQRCPNSGNIMINLKPGEWISPEEQRRCISSKGPVGLSRTGG